MMYESTLLDQQRIIGSTISLFVTISPTGTSRTVLSERFYSLYMSLFVVLLDFKTTDGNVSFILIAINYILLAIEKRKQHENRGRVLKKMLCMCNKIFLATIIMIEFGSFFRPSSRL